MGGVRASVAGLIVDLEASYAGRETRRIDLTHALYHLGKASDAEGSIRTAMQYKSTLVASEAGKHFIETGNALSGGTCRDNTLLAMHTARQRPWASPQSPQPPAVGGYWTGIPRT